MKDSNPKLINPVKIKRNHSPVNPPFPNTMEMTAPSNPTPCKSKSYYRKITNIILTDSTAIVIPALVLRKLGSHARPSIPILIVDASLCLK